MRIFLVCMQATRRHAIPAYSFWEDYFKHGLEEAGHQWVEADGVDWAELLADPDRALHHRTWQRALDQIGTLHRQQPIDLFLSYLFPEQIVPAAIQAVRDLGIPCVNFFCDNVREYRSVPAEFRGFDLHWVPEYKALGMYRRAGLPHVHAAMPVWIPVEQRVAEHPENFPPTFIGSWDAQRCALLAEAVGLGAPIEICGHGWTNDAAPDASAAGPPRRLSALLRSQWSLVRRQGILAPLWKAACRLQADRRCVLPKERLGPVISRADYVRRTQQSVITLGVNRYRSFRRPFWWPDTYSRMRDVEAPMMGACYLTEWTEGIERMYDLDAEIATYRNAEELVEQIERLTASPERRRSMRSRAQQRALAEHSVVHSLATIQRTLGLR